MKRRKPHNGPKILYDVKKEVKLLEADHAASAIASRDLAGFVRVPLLCEQVFGIGSDLIRQTEDARIKAHQYTIAHQRLRVVAHKLTIWERTSNWFDFLWQLFWFKIARNV